MKRKQEDELDHGDGIKWFRGSMIGKGSFGSVYLATLKKPKSRYSYLPVVLAVKSAEISVSASIQKEKEVFNNVQGCPYVLRCFGEEITTGKNGEMIYNLLLEYASGGTVADHIKKSNGSGLPESDVRHYTRSILKGLKHIHECGYVHCDLKPDNILLVPNSTSKFVAKIADFGLAKRANGSKKRSRLDPYLRGTRQYLSPEAVIDNVQEPPSDIWALGCVVLEMLTGKPSWDKKPDLVSEDVLCRICKKGELPKVPSEISKEGKDFLKGCFVRKGMFRLTAEMLLNHPFVEGLDGEDGEVKEFEVVSDAGGARGLTSSLPEDGDDLSSDFSDDWSSVSEEDSPFSSWSAEEEGINIQGFSSTVEEAIMGVKKQPMGQSQSTFTIPARFKQPVRQYQSTITIPAGV